MNRMNVNGVASSYFAGGIVVPLMDRKHLDFSYLAKGTRETIVLAEAANVAMATSALLVVRIHVNNLASGTSIVIDCIPTAPSSEDPAEFSDTVEDITASVSSQSAPFYLDVALSTPPKGAWWKVELTGVQHASEATTVAAQLSAFLVLRDG